MKRSKYILFAVTVAIVQAAVLAFGQSSPPGSDVYLAPLSLKDGSFTVGRWTNITARPGYDNQPFFGPDETYILFASIDTSGQTDVYSYDIARSTVSRVTKTPESEYSPTVIPGTNCFSTVRVEADGKQRLWQFDLDGANPRLVLAAVDSIGYHTWATDNTLGLFVLGEPHTLRIVDVSEDADRIAAFDIGRSLHTIPGTNAISFVQIVKEDEWWITRLDLESGTFNHLTRTLPRSQDFAWTPDGNVIMAQDSLLFRWTGGDDWKPVAGFEPRGLKNISRLAVSPRGRWLALVADDS